MVLNFSRFSRFYDKIKFHIVTYSASCCIFNTFETFLAFCQYKTTLAKTKASCRKPIDTFLLIVLKKFKKFILIIYYML